MSSFITILLIGISLSMDAFSLSLAYGMIGMNNQDKILLSTIVGIYHFLMPLIGLLLAILIINLKLINFNIVAIIILTYIGIDLILSNFKKEIIVKNNYLLFGLSVSIDSLSVGIGLKAITNNYLLAAIIFSLCSFLFTYLGLILGNTIAKKLGSYSRLFGGIMLIIIAIIMLTQQFY